MARRIALTIVFCGLYSLAFGQGSQLPKYTVATLPSATNFKSYTVQVIDGTTNTDCTVGGASGTSAHNALCQSQWKGSAYVWTPVSSNGGIGSINSQTGPAINVHSSDASITVTTTTNDINLTTAGSGTTTNALTFNNGGTGDASGSTFNGSAAKTLSYNSIGAAPLASPTFTGNVTVGGGLQVNAAGQFTNVSSHCANGAFVNGAAMSMFTAGGGANFTQDGSCGALIIPNTSTVWQSNGVDGMVDNYTSGPPGGGGTAAVGGYFQARGFANGSYIWGTNWALLAMAPNVNAQNEIDMDVLPGATNATMTALDIAAPEWDVAPVYSVGVALQHPNGLSGAKWGAGLVTNAGSTDAAVIAGPTATGASANSAQIAFQATSAGSATLSAGIRENFSGDLLLTSSGGASLSIPAAGNILKTSSGLALTLQPTGNVIVGSGLQVNGSVSGYGGAEVTLAGGSGSQNAISTTGTAAPSIAFDHRGTANAGTWIWRNGTGAANTQMALDASGNLTVSANVKIPTLVSAPSLATNSSGQLIATGGSGTFTVGTTAIAANSCTTAATVTLTGTATTSAFMITPSSDTSGVTGWGSVGGLTIVSWPTANTFNYKVCNQTGASITPSASASFNIAWR